MKIDLNRSDGSTTEFEISINPSEIDLESEIAQVNGSIVAAGEVSNGENVTVVEAEVTAPLTINCSRCLKEAVSDHQIGFRKIGQ